MMRFLNSSIDSMLVEASRLSCTIWPLVWPKRRQVVVAVSALETSLAVKAVRCELLGFQPDAHGETLFAMIEACLHALDRLDLRLHNANFR